MSSSTNFLSIQLHAWKLRRCSVNICEKEEEKKNEGQQGKREKEGVISLKPIFIVLLKGKILFLLLKTHLTNDEYKCFHTNLFSNSWWTQPRCPPIYVNSVSVYIFLSQILQAIGTVPQDCPSCRS